MSDKAKKDVKDSKTESKTPEKKKGNSFLKNLPQRVRNRAAHTFRKVGYEYFVFRSFISLSFFFAAFLVFTPLLRQDSDLIRSALALYGILVLVLCVSLIYETLVKVVRAQRNSTLPSYSVVTSINLFFGFTMGMFIFNQVLSIVVNCLAQMRYYGTFLCEIRIQLVDYYNDWHIYFTISQLVFWSLILTVVLLTFGGLIERVFSRK